MDEHQLLVQLLTEVRDTNRDLLNSNRALVEELGKIREWCDWQRRYMNYAPIMYAVMFVLTMLGFSLLRLIP